MKRLMLLLVLLLGASAAWADETVTVDYASALGPATHKASGVRGILPQYPPPTNVLADLKISTTVTDAGPWSGIAWINSTMRPYGLTYYIEELGTGWNNGDMFHYPFPCDNNDCSSWAAYVTSKYQFDQSVGATDQVYAFWNEPDTNWLPPIEQFYQAWKSAYQTLHALNPNVKMTAPSPSEYGPSGHWVHQFLDYCKANGGIYPTYLNWHELAAFSYPSVNAAVAADVAEARAYMASIGAPDIPILIGEYAAQGSYHWAPGHAIQYAAVFERSPTVLGASRACYLGEINGDSTCFKGAWNGMFPADGSYQPRSLYWAYKAYGDITGTMVSVTPGSSVDGAAGMTTNQTVTVLGRDNIGAPETVTVQFTNLNSAPGFTGVSSVHVVANAIPNSGLNLMASMTKTIDADYPVSGQSVSIPVPNFGGLDAYQLILTPGPGGLPPPLTFTPSTLSAGTVGIQYIKSITVSNGIPPYSCSGTSAPPGLVWSRSPSNTCVLSGTPTTAGSFGTTLTATDSRSPTYTSTFPLYSLTIAPAIQRDSLNAMDASSERDRRRFW